MLHHTSSPVIAIHRGAQSPNSAMHKPRPDYCDVYRSITLSSQSQQPLPIKQTLIVLRHHDWRVRSSPKWMRVFFLSSWNNLPSPNARRAELLDCWKLSVYGCHSFTPSEADRVDSRICRTLRHGNNSNDTSNVQVHIAMYKRVVYRNWLFSRNSCFKINHVNFFLLRDKLLSK